MTSASVGQSQNGSDQNSFGFGLSASESRVVEATCPQAEHNQLADPQSCTVFSALRKNRNPADEIFVQALFCALLV